VIEEMGLKIFKPEIKFGFKVLMTKISAKKTVVT
jgi:hypothetical protein